MQHTELAQPRSPFERYAALTPPTIEVAQLGPGNIAEVAYFMVTRSNGAAVFVAAGRECIICDNTRFDVGDWIVADIRQGPGGTYRHFRHATEQERTDYGLKELTL